MPKGYRKDGTKIIPPSNKGKYFSSEHKMRIGLGNRGKKCPFLYERNRSLDMRKKVSSSLMGHKVSNETKAKISNTLLGKKHSLETKLKMSERRKGDRHPNWKGGITSLVQQIRHCFEYRQWRSDVFTRDNFTCIWCGKKGNIEADHIKRFSTIFHENKITSLEEAIKCEEFWNINNGRTLCKVCHDKTKKGFGRPKKWPEYE